MPWTYSHTNRMAHPTANPTAAKIGETAPPVSCRFSRSKLDNPTGSQGNGNTHRKCSNTTPRKPAAVWPVQHKIVNRIKNCNPISSRRSPLVQIVMGQSGCKFSINTGNVSAANNNTPQNANHTSAAQNKVDNISCPGYSGRRRAGPGRAGDGQGRHRGRRGPRPAP